MAKRRNEMKKEEVEAPLMEARGPSGHLGVEDGKKKWSNNGGDGEVLMATFAMGPRLSSHFWIDIHGASPIHRAMRVLSYYLIGSTQELVLVARNRLHYVPGYVGGVGYCEAISFSSCPSVHSDRTMNIGMYARAMVHITVFLTIVIPSANVHMINIFIGDGPTEKWTLLGTGLDLKDCRTGLGLTIVFSDCAVLSTFGATGGCQPTGQGAQFVSRNSF